MNEEPFALRLAGALEQLYKTPPSVQQAAKELRRLHEENTALRQAIKDEEEAFRPDYDTNAVLLERIRELEQEAALTGLAATSREIEQKPVGEVLNIQWMSNTGGWLIGFHSKRRLYKGDKLYVEPVRREWQGLDDNEIQATDHFCGDVFEFARAIEAKLKERNT